MWRHLVDIICLTFCLFFFSGGQVAKLYHDASLGNVVNIIVTRLIVLTEDQVGKKTLTYSNTTDIINAVLARFFLGGRGCFYASGYGSRGREDI